MKRVFSAITVFFLIFSIVQVHADSTAPIKKFGRGIANIVTCPFELSLSVQEANVKNGFWAAFSWGILEGAYKSLIRCLVGIYEVVTFPIPLPKDYAPILTDPEFMWEEKEGFERR